MRKHFLFLMAAIGFLSLFPVHSALLHSHSNETQKEEERSTIDLKGKLETGPGFRSATDPIVAEKQGSSVFVYFQKNVGLLQVTVTGAQGQVFYTSANTATQTTLTISLAGLPAGEYVITFSNEKGMMTGNFSL